MGVNGHYTCTLHCMDHEWSFIIVSIHTFSYRATADRTVQYRGKRYTSKVTLNGHSLSDLPINGKLEASKLGRFRSSR